MNDHASLLLLLDLLSDPSTQLDEAGLPVILQNANDKEQWRRLNAILDAAPSGAPPDSPHESVLDESAVAAYVEGQLSSAEALSVESICWSDDWAMREVAAVHRELAEPPPLNGLSQSLHLRLLALPELTATPDARPTNRIAGSPTGQAEPAPGWELPAAEPTSSSATNGIAPTPPVPPPLPVEPPIAPGGVKEEFVARSQLAESAGANTDSGSLAVASRGRQDDRQKRFPWGAVIGVVSLVALVVLAVWFRQKDLGIDGGAKRNQIALPPSYPESEANQKGPSDDGPKRVPQVVRDGPGPIESAPDGDRFDSPIQVRPDRPSDATPPAVPKTDVDPSVPSTSPTQPRRRTPVYQTLALNWSKVEGLVMARADRLQPWQGAQSEQLPIDANDFVTLPGSWAQADAGRMGTVVVDSDTRFTVDSGNDDVAAIQLHRGRVAFTGAEEETEYEIVVGQHTVSVHAQKAASFALVHSPSGPQVWVRRGEVDLKGITVRKGQRSRWGGAAFSKAESVNQGSTWFDRPPRNAVRLTKDIQERLLSSANVHDDLLQLSNNGDANMRRIALGWNVVVDPQRHFYAALRSPDFAVRLQACRWLGAQLPRELDRLIWPRLASQSGDTTYTRHLAIWNKLLWERQAMTPAEAKTKSMPRVEAVRLVRALSHNDAAIRQLSNYFLELEFGAGIKFNPVAPAASQRRAVQAWSQILRREYGAGAQGNPSQRGNQNQRGDVQP